MRKARVGLIGLGEIGRFHADTLARRVASVELVGVVDAVEAVARSVGTEHDVPWSTSYDRLLNDPDVEAIAIATPTPLHPEMIERAAGAGKHVFSEKPLGLALEPSLRAVEAAQAAGVLLQVGFVRRFDPDWRAARDKIVAGDLGEVYLFRSCQRETFIPPTMDYLDSVGDMFTDMLIHEFDLARWMVGEVVEVTTYGASLSSPAFADIGDVDTALVMCRFESGAIGVIDGTRLAGYGYEVATEVLGSRATLRIGDRRRPHDLELLTSGQVAAPHALHVNETLAEAFKREFEHFAECVVTGTSPSVTGADGVAAFVIAQAAVTSFRENRAVALDRPDGSPLAYRLQATTG